jgi:integrase
VEQPEILPPETLIYTPDELCEMLSAVRPKLVPWLVMGAFCGLRTAEVLRLDWAQVNLERRFVEVRALNAKTAARRLVPLCEAAVAWLVPHRRIQGRLAAYSEENKFVTAVVEDVNKVRHISGKQPRFAWKKNALRHSFCSYRLALTHDTGRTALEAGNSPTIIFRHYRELVTEEEAKTWFGVTPNPSPAPAEAETFAQHSDSNPKGLE